MLRSTRDIRSMRQFFDGARDQLVDLGGALGRGGDEVARERLRGRVDLELEHDRPS